jgi:hypothetical protein
MSAAPRQVTCVAVRAALPTSDEADAPTAVPGGELPEDAAPALTVGKVYEVLGEPFDGWITVEDDDGEECCFPADLFGDARGRS